MQNSGLSCELRIFNSVYRLEALKYFCTVFAGTGKGDDLSCK